MKTRTLLLAPVLFALTIFSAGALDWYRWRGPDLNGVSKETGDKLKAAVDKFAKAFA